MIRWFGQIIASPSKHIAEASLARRLRVIAATLAVLLGTGIPTVVVVLLVYPEQFRGDPWVTGAFISALVLLYVGIRSRWGLAALWVFATTGTALTWVMLGTSEDGVDLAAGIPLAFLPLVIGALIPSRWALPTVMVTTLAGIAWCVYQVPDLTPTAASPLAVMMLLSTIALGGLQWIAEADRQEVIRSLVAEAAAKEQAARAEEIRHRLLLTAHHELRTPLNGILGATELMLDEELPDYTRALVEAARISGRRLQALVEDLLVFVDDQQGALRLHADPLDLAEVARQLVDELGPAATERGVAVHLAPTPAVTVTDRRRITQIVRHLVSNATRFTEEGRVDVCTGRDHEHAWVEVRDTGPGMSPDELELALTPLRQVSEGAARSAEGLGLGLAASRVLARALGGELQVRSAPGGGTVATVSVPARAP